MIRIPLVGLALALSLTACGGGSSGGSAAFAPGGPPQAGPQSARVVALSGRPVKFKEVYESGRPSNRTVTDANGFFDLPEAPVTPVATDLGDAAPIVTQRGIWSRLLESEAYAATSGPTVVQFTRSPDVPTATPMVLGFDAPTTTASIVVPPPPTPTSDVLADWDGDGTLDALVFGPASAQPQDVEFRRGLGGGNFAAPVVITQTTQPTGIVAGDLDGDGRTDILVTSDFEAAIFYQTAAPTVLRVQAVSNKRATSPAFADIDGDRVAEVVFKSDDTNPINGGAMRIVRRSGAVEARILPNGPHSQFSVLDLNGDTIADMVAVAGGSPVLTVLFGVPRLGPVDQVSYNFTLAGGFSSEVRFVDLDGDGTLDFLASHGGAWMRGR